MHSRTHSSPGAIRRDSRARTRLRALWGLELSAVAIRAERVAEPAADDELPVVVAASSELEAAAKSLRTDRRERLASEVDPLAARAGELARTMTLDVLDEAAAVPGPEEELYERAFRERDR